MKRYITLALLLLFTLSLTVSASGQENTAPTAAAPGGTAEEYGITEAIMAGILDARATGNTISRSFISMTNRTDQAIRINVDAGHVLISLTGGVQDMLVLTPVSVELAPREEAPRVAVETACMDISEPIPDSDTNFILFQSAPGSSLIQLVDLFAQTNIPWEVKQAAVWMLTDKADYEAMGILRGSGGDRAIGQDDYAAAKALTQSLAPVPEILDQAVMITDDTLVYQGKLGAPLVLVGDEVPEPMPAVTTLHLRDVVDMHGNLFVAFPNLQVINAFNAHISEYSWSGTPVSLKSLTASYFPFYGLQTLSRLTSLETLRLDAAGITDVSALASLTGLKELSLGGNQIEDISALNGLINLEALDLSDNPINDFTPIDGLAIPNLKK